MLTTRKMSNRIKQLLPGVEEQVLLSDYTTFKIGGPARFFVEVQNKEEVIAAIQWARDNDVPFFVLGGGSNLLVSGKGYDGLVIKMKNEKVKKKSENLKSKIIECEAGVQLSDLVVLSLQEGLSGLEWAAGIPQVTVGGAVRGNAGAFGQTMADIVKEVEVLEVQNLKFKIRSFKNTECKFRYKDSLFKKNQNFIILSVVLRLEKKNKSKIKKAINEVLAYRKKNHPSELSAGSVFKNVALKFESREAVGKLKRRFPEIEKFIKQKFIPAGWLIEQCGLKGNKIGQAQISPKHGNFIVNLGGASFSDVLKLVNLIRKQVKEKFGLKLEEEICIGR